MSKQRNTKISKRRNTKSNHLPLFLPPTPPSQGRHHKQFQSDVFEIAEKYFDLYPTRLCATLNRFDLAETYHPKWN